MTRACGLPHRMSIAPRLWTLASCLLVATGCAPQSSTGPLAAPVLPPVVVPPAVMNADPITTPNSVPVVSPSTDVAIAESDEPATSASTPQSPAAWVSVLPQINPEQHTVAGQWTKTPAGLRCAAANGARIAIPVSPQGEYDVRVSFTRHTGQHSVALFFPHGTGRAAFEVDAWGSHLGGLQNIAGQALNQQNPRRDDVALTNGQRSTLLLEVRSGEVRGLLDGRVIVTQRTTGSDLALPPLWNMPDPKLLGVGAWDSETTFHAIEVRQVNGTPLQMASRNAPAAAPPTTPTFQPPRPTAVPAAPTAPIGRTPVAANQSVTGKRVLIVIANYHFFYREYGDPREELERAGIRVTVAAGRREPCVPHTGSGEGSDRGIVRPDLAIADARAADYDAILFSGGWGSSAYQFAFPGRYDTPQYNGDRETKAAVNRLIGDFVAQEKYVAALCNAVSVLAWARVNGESPLSGKRVCAPTRQAAAGIYNGAPAQPSCRWHPEANGAVLSPAGALGRPGTAIDDVLVDGRIVTGEDDISAREMGRRLAQLLATNSNSPTTRSGR